jgi:hypothetical protein
MAPDGPVATGRSQMDHVSCRRLSKVVSGLLAVLAVAVALQVNGAAAGRTWCKMDPVIAVDGRLANIYIATDAGIAVAGTGPVQLVVSVPPGVSFSLVSADAGFGFGYQVSFKTWTKLRASATVAGIMVEAYVPSTDGGLPVQLQIVPAATGRVSGSRTGTTNQWVVTTGTV